MGSNGRDDPCDSLSRSSTRDGSKARPAKAAFGYFGSKARIAKRILNCLPPHHCWVELCCGSAALTMAKKPAQIEIINDLDGEVVNVFRQLRDRGEELVRAIEFTPYAHEEFVACLGDVGEADDLERARRFLVRAMMAVNGVLAKGRGGFSHSNTYSRGGREARVNRWVRYPARLEAVALRLRDVRIENRDAIELLRMFSNRPASLVYIDPPYLTERTSGYTVDVEDDEFHVSLLEEANVARCMIVISGYESELYTDRLSVADGWEKLDLGAYTKTTNGSAIPRQEGLWLNKAGRSSEATKESAGSSFQGGEGEWESESGTGATSRQLTGRKRNDLKRKSFRTGRHQVFAMTRRLTRSGCRRACFVVSGSAPLELRPAALGERSHPLGDIRRGRRPCAHGRISRYAACSPSSR